MLPKIVKPDAKGRIALGRLTKGVTEYMLTKINNKIILEPCNISPAEKQLLNDKVTLKYLEQGLEDLIAHRLLDKGSFIEFSNLDIDNAI